MKFDPVNFALCCIGVAIWGALVYYKILPFDLVWKILAGEAG